MGAHLTDFERFNGLVQRLAWSASTSVPSHGLAVGWFGVLDALYSSPGRYYHDGAHVSDLCRRLDAEVRPWDSRDNIELAIWFHDAIYTERATDNEDRSADLCAAFIASLGSSTGIVNLRDDVLTAILATKHREPTPPRAMSTLAIMVDLDLAGFADPWDVFEERNQAIRQEYAFASDEQYAIGRSAFLTKLLTRQRIYSVLTDLEAPARANILRHVRELLAA